jgi:hypothetical protein
VSDTPPVRGDGIGPALGGEGSPCPVVEFGGQTWKVGWPTERARLRQEFLVAEYAENELKKQREFLDPRAFAAKWAALESDVRAGHHRVGGALWDSVFSGPAGMPVVLLALLREHHPEATLDTAWLLYYSGTDSVRMALAKVLPPFATLLVQTAPVNQEEKARRAQTLADAMLEMAGCPTPKPSAAPSA